MCLSSKKLLVTYDSDPTPTASSETHLYNSFALRLNTFLNILKIELRHLDFLLLLPFLSFPPSCLEIKKPKEKSPKLFVLQRNGRNFSLKLYFPKSQILNEQGDPQRERTLFCHQLNFTSRAKSWCETYVKKSIYKDFHRSFKLLELLKCRLKIVHSCIERSALWNFQIPPLKIYFPKDLQDKSIYLQRKDLRLTIAWTWCRKCYTHPVLPSAFSLCRRITSRSYFKRK